MENTHGNISSVLEPPDWVMIKNLLKSIYNSVRKYNPLVYPLAILIEY